MALPIADADALILATRRLADHKGRAVALAGQERAPFLAMRVSDDVLDRFGPRPALEWVPARARCRGAVSVVMIMARFRGLADLSYEYFFDYLAQSDYRAFFRAMSAPTLRFFFASDTRHISFEVPNDDPVISPVPERVSQEYLRGAFDWGRRRFSSALTEYRTVIGGGADAWHVVEHLGTDFALTG